MCLQFVIKELTDINIGDFMKSIFLSMISFTLIFSGPVEAGVLAERMAVRVEKKLAKKVEALGSLEQKKDYLNSVLDVFENAFDKESREELSNEKNTIIIKIKRAISHLRNEVYLSEDSKSLMELFRNKQKKMALSDSELLEDLETTKFNISGQMDSSVEDSDYEWSLIIWGALILLPIIIVFQLLKCILKEGRFAINCAE